jgi:hypothetical protein
MGAFVGFLDTAYGFAASATGLVAGQFVYAAVYLFSAASYVLGVKVVLCGSGLWRNSQRSMLDGPRCPPVRIFGLISGQLLLEQARIQRNG